MAFILLHSHHFNTGVINCIDYSGLTDVFGDERGCSWDCLDNRRCGPYSVVADSSKEENRLKTDKKFSIVLCTGNQRFYNLKYEQNHC